MITDAVWVDWDGDGAEDLVVAGEWMSPRVFRNEGGRLADITGELGLEALTGWWNAVHASDLDGDGRRSEEHTSELQSRGHLVCRLLLEKKNAARVVEL